MLPKIRLKLISSEEKYFDNITSAEIMKVIKEFNMNLSFVGLIILIFVEKKKMQEGKMEIATLAGGCFWCTEAVFERVKGTSKVIPGFTGGTIKNPGYREIITGRTGHAEAIQIHFDPSEVSYEELLYIFFSTHDPTTLNRQQYDVGTQYRSAIFYHTEEQRKIAEKVIAKLEEEEIFEDPIVTELTEAPAFYEAEPEHKEYYSKHRQQQYCQVIIDPKIKKLKELYSNKVKLSI